MKRGVRALPRLAVCRQKMEKRREFEFILWSRIILSGWIPIHRDHSSHPSLLPGQLLTCVSGFGWCRPPPRPRREPPKGVQL